MIPISFQHDLSFAGTHIEDTTNIATIGLKPGGKLEVCVCGGGRGVPLPSGGVYGVSVQFEFPGNFGF